MKEKNFEALINQLKAGNKRYRDDSPLAPKDNHRDQKRRDHYLDKKNKQEPAIILLSCADSRVTPELIFDAGIGELFVVRVAGNIANPASIASIEYAVDNLKPQKKVLIVLGHESCGAVEAAVATAANDKSLGYHLDQLLAFIRPALQVSSAIEGKNKYIKQNAFNTLKVLQRQSTTIRCAVANGHLKIIPALYKLNGEVVLYEKEWQILEA